MIRFREGHVDDSDVRELLAEYFVERVAGFPPDLGAYRTAPPAPGMFGGGVFLVADDEGVAVGCGGIRPLPSDAGSRFEVKHLFLRPAARGRGAGRALMEELERRARELGGTELVLDTNRSLEAAGALYSRLGYAAIAAYNDNPNATDWYRKELAQ